MSVFCTQKLDTYSHPKIAFELKIFRTVPTDLIRQLCRVENISKPTLGTCLSEVNQKF